MHTPHKAYKYEVEPTSEPIEIVFYKDPDLAKINRELTCTCENVYSQFQVKREQPIIFHTCDNVRKSLSAILNRQPPLSIVGNPPPA